jgi:predicted DNA-binding transcriptional regulator AlpA
MADHSEKALPKGDSANGLTAPYASCGAKTCGLGRGCPGRLWRLERQGQFPARRILTANAVGWIAGEVEAWIVTRSFRPSARAFGWG